MKKPNQGHPDGACGVRLVCRQRGDGWWIVDDAGRLPDHGPYDTRREADEDRVGLARFCRAHPTYV